MWFISSTKRDYLIDVEKNQIYLHGVRNVEYKIFCFLKIKLKKLIILKYNHVKNPGRENIDSRLRLYLNFIIGLLFICIIIFSDDNIIGESGQENISYQDGWKSNNFNITIFMNVSLEDIDTIQLEVNSTKLDKGEITTWNEWILSTEWNNSCPFFYNFSGESGYAYRFRMRANTTTVPQWRDWIYATNTEEEINTTKIDTTNPVKGKIINIPVTNNNTKLNITLTDWYDLESDIINFKYQITNQTDIVVDWIILEGNVSEIEDNSTIFGDGIYYFNVSALNGANSWSEIMISKPIILYTQKPVCNIWYHDGWQNNSLNITIYLNIYGKYIKTIQLEMSSTKLENGELLNWDDWKLQKEWNNNLPPYYNFTGNNSYAYKFRIRAINSIVTNWSDYRYATNAKLEINITKIDIIKPIKGKISGAPITDENKRLSVILSKWYDLESDIINIKYQITNQTGVVIDWIISPGNNSEIIDNSRIFGDGIYYFNISVQNGAKLWSDIDISNAIKIYSELPICKVNYTNSWQNNKLRFYIRISVIGEYISTTELWINSTLEKGNLLIWSGWTNLTDWVDSRQIPEYYLFNDGQNGFAYQFRIRANNSISNKFGKWSSEITNINILRLDITPPVDGIVQTPLETNDRTLITAEISGFSDEESDIVEYQYKIMDKIDNEVRGWTTTNSTVEASGLSLENGESYFLHIRGKNGAGNWSNIIQSTMIIYTQLPDLTFRSAKDFYFEKKSEDEEDANYIIPETEIRVGDSLSIWVGVHNIGKGSASDVSVKINLITQNGTIPIGTAVIDFIGAGESNVTEFFWNVTDIENGTYSIKIEADYVKLINEENEQNNEIEKTISIKPKIELIVEEDSYLWIYALFGILLLVCIGEYFFINKYIKARAYDSSVIEDVFMLYKDGRLILHETRRLRPEVDEDVIGSMLTAVQEFVGDALSDEQFGTLGKLEYGKLQILINSGTYLIIAAISSGEPPKSMRDLINKTIIYIEEKYSEVLEDWDGVAADLSPTKKIIRETIISGKPIKKEKSK